MSDHQQDADVPPSASNRDKVIQAKKSFQNMCCVGTLGFFFVTLFLAGAQVVAQFHSLQDPQLWRNLLNLGYLAWFLVYFFTSNFRNDFTHTQDTSEPSARDIGVDVAQACSAFVAAYTLGYLSPHGTNSDYGFIWVNGMVAFICAISLWAYAERDRGTPLNYIRAAGLCLGLLMAFAAWAAIHHTFNTSKLIAWLFLSLILLWVFLLRFLMQSLDSD